MFEITSNNLNFILDDVKIGYILFDEKDDYIVGSYIYLNPDMRGKGYSTLLIERFVELSKEKNKKIFPTCPVIKRTLEENYPDYLK